MRGTGERGGNDSTHAWNSKRKLIKKLNKIPGKELVLSMIQKKLINFLIKNSSNWLLIITYLWMLYLV